MSTASRESARQLPMYGWLVMTRRLQVSPHALAWRLYNLGYIHESERDWALGEGASLLKEMERAFYDEPLEPPKVPSLSERARALVLHAYREEQMTASAAARHAGAYPLRRAGVPHGSHDGHA
jgi:hypothetical protein